MADRIARGGTLVLGGGFAGSYVAKLLKRRGATVVSSENYLVYTPMLPEAAPVPARSRRAGRPHAPARAAGAGAVRAAALVVGLALALAGCGGSDGNDGGAAPPAGPADPPPERPGEGPPPAWVETEGGSTWLAYSTYCWASTCADFTAPSCAGDAAAPRVELRRGETVRFHLGFDPGEALLTFFPEGAEPDGVTLDPSRTPTWHADRAGAFTVFAGGDGRDASYAGCAVLR